MLNSMFFREGGISRFMNPAYTSGVNNCIACVYLQNKEKVDGFLRSQGINIPESASKDYSSMPLEELVSTKEHIEDLIAEMEQKSDNNSAQKEDK